MNMPDKEYSSSVFPITTLWCYRSFFTLISSLVNANILFVAVMLFPLLQISFGWMVVAGLAMQLVSVLLSLFYNLIWRRNYRFVFAPEGIVLSSGIISKSQRTIPYYTIQNVIRSKDLFGYLAGITTIHIENAAAGIVFSGGAGQMSSGIVIPGLSDADAGRIYAVLVSVMRANRTVQTV